jgi:hypothetical protein
MDALVRRVLARHLVDDRRVSPNYSLLSTAADDRRGRGVWFVYRGGSAIARRRTAAGALRSLVAQIDVHAQPPTGITRLDAVVISDGDRVVIGPAMLRMGIAGLDARLRRTRWSVTDLPFVEIDVTGALVVPERALDADMDVIERMEGGRPPETRPVVPGRYPVAGWLSFEPFPDAPPLDRPHLVAGQMANVTNLDTVDAATALQSVTQALDGSEIAHVGSFDPVEIVSHLDAW